MKVKCQGIFQCHKECKFFHLRNKILILREKAIKEFFDEEDEPINIEEYIINYKIFKYKVDSNRFVEYRPTNFRCRNCKRELKKENFICSHTNKCRTTMKLKYKSNIYEIEEGRVYFNKKNQNENENDLNYISPINIFLKSDEKDGKNELSKDNPEELIKSNSEHDDEEEDEKENIKNIDLKNEEKIENYKRNNDINQEENESDDNKEESNDDKERREIRREISDIIEKSSKRRKKKEKKVHDELKENLRKFLREEK